MAVADPPQAPQGRTRPSRARGLRTSTGCLTCKTRRVKCDEGKPICRGCARSDDRKCVYSNALGDSISSEENQHLPSPTARPPENESLSNNAQIQSTDQEKLLEHFPVDTTSQPDSVDSGIGDCSQYEDIQTQLRWHSFGQSIESVQGPESFNSPAQSLYLIDGSRGSSTPLTPGDGTLEWYDLVAQDAVIDVDKIAIAESSPRWNFDDGVSHRKVGREKVQSMQHDTDSGGLKMVPNRDVDFKAHEIEYLTYYIRVVAPMLDFFDRSCQFTEVVPQLARRNIGLAKSIFAAAARHKSLHGLAEEARNRDCRYATEFLYDALNSLASAIQDTAYAQSQETLATVVMISTCEMLNGSSKELERHLRGAFWIHRHQTNDGESTGLRRATWWAWLRQDIWAAFSNGRKTLTMWTPKENLATLSADDLALRICYISAKVVDYVSREAIQTQEWHLRLTHGERLQQDLDDWFSVLPDSYKPLPGHGFWVNPPPYAGALQYYYFSTLVLSLHRPFLGGITEHRAREKTITETVENVINIVRANATSHAMALVNFQALDAARLCSEGPQNMTVYIIACPIDTAIEFLY
ncbi:hypothetical protein LTR84_007122 [Exophiala bonariae]|uniref:Zn(2)-C6 fungal-type domain-containing protein n=1 Tax=Exophiala bonariae TaxID=1690606 RepID=A0AAV9MYF3_9EURO|nr:hypothetical protein LTR84_007122 [Exophiala bonariae]